jgi:DNA-binding transcriptional MerR regulator
MNTSELPELLRASEAARRLGIHVRTLAAWSANGTAPQPVRLGPGQRRFYRLADIEQMTESGAAK